MITLSLVLILPVSSVIMGLLGFWVGRCARKLPIIDNNLPWTLHRSQIPAAAEEDPVKSGPSSDRWPRGKLSRIVYFPGLGYNAADTDDGWCRPMPDGRQRWRDDAIERPLAVQGAGVLFVAGCEENQVRFQPRFDVIVLLSAPAEVLAGRHGNPEPVTRTARRPVNSAGSSMTCGPSSRSCAKAEYEIRTTMPLGEVFRALLRLTGA